MGKLLRRLAVLFRWRRFEADLDEELRLHRALSQRELDRSRTDRLTTPQRPGALLARDESRNVWLSPWLESVLQDTRVGLRGLWRTPGFTAAVVLTLALGVGAVAAVFTLADPMLFRPLPFPDSDRVLQVRVDGDGPSGLPQLPDLVALQSGTASFAAVTSFELLAAGRIDGTDHQALIYGVTPGFFDVLRAKPVLGRLFLPEEYTVRDVARFSGTAAADGSADVALMSHALWRTMFGGRSTIIGETIRLTGPRPASFHIVGVLPADFCSADDQSARGFAGANATRPREPNRHAPCGWPHRSPQARGNAPRRRGRSAGGAGARRS